MKKKLIIFSITIAAIIIFVIYQKFGIIKPKYARDILVNKESVIVSNEKEKALEKLGIQVDPIYKVVDFVLKDLDLDSSNEIIVFGNPRINAETDCCEYTGLSVLRLDHHSNKYKSIYMDGSKISSTGKLIQETNAYLEYVSYEYYKENSIKDIVEVDRDKLPQEKTYCMFRDENKNGFPEVFFFGRSDGPSIGATDIFEMVNGKFTNIYNYGGYIEWKDLDGDGMDEAITYGRDSNVDGFWYHFWVFKFNKRRLVFNKKLSFDLYKKKLKQDILNYRASKNIDNLYQVIDGYNSLRRFSESLDFIKKASKELDAPIEDFTYLTHCTLSQQKDTRPYFYEIQ